MNEILKKDEFNSIFLIISNYFFEETSHITNKYYSVESKYSSIFSSVFNTIGQPSHVPYIVLKVDRTRSKKIADKTAKYILLVIDETNDSPTFSSFKSQTYSN